jgi:hypothetical protein
MKITKLLLIVVAVLILIPFLGRFVWVLQKGKKMEIMIVNKSVQKQSQNEIKSLNYVLNMHKIVKSTGQFYVYSRDYYGYHPEAVTNDFKIKSFRLDELATIKEKYDALYFLDNSGVNLEGKNIVNYASYYGGFNQNDYVLLKNMLNSGKLIIAEYNFISEPTEELVRYNTEQLIDIYSIGWKGRYFSNLSANKIVEELDPEWMEVYKGYYNESWEFEGSGLVFINENQKRIVVLPSNLYMNAKFPVIESSPEMVEYYQIPAEVSFTGWFDVMYPGKNKVVSSFNMKLNEEGTDILMRNGLESAFPAVIKSQNDKLFLFTGDFSKQKFMYCTSRISGVNHIVQSLTRGGVNKPYRFIHTYYEPFVSKILLDYYNENIKTVK